MGEDAVTPEVPAAVRTESTESDEALLRGKIALSILRRRGAVERAEGLGRPRLLAVLYARLAEALRASGELDAALVAYESALRALATVERPDVSELLRAIAAHPKFFNPDRVFDLPVIPVAPMLPSLEEAESDPRLLVRLLLDIGSGYLEQPQETVAAGRFEEALGRPEIQGDPRLVAQAKTGLALARLGLGDTAAAESLLAEALGLFGDTPERRHALTALGSVRAAQRDTQGALAAWQEALLLHRAARPAEVASEPPAPWVEGQSRLGEGDVAAEARVLGSIAQMHLDAGQIGLATPAFEEARQVAARVQDFDARAHAAWGLARCKIADGDLDGAVAPLRDCIHWIEARRMVLRRDEAKVRYLGGRADVYALLISLHVDRAKKAWKDALDVAERGRGTALRDLLLEWDSVDFAPRAPLAD